MPKKKTPFNAKDYERDYRTRVRTNSAKRQIERQVNKEENAGGQGRPTKTQPFKTFHTLAAGETRNSPFTNPNLIFFTGGALLIVADAQRIKKVFQYAWGANTVQDAAKHPADFWAALKVILVQLVFLFLITMSARVIPPLGRMWLIVIIGLWILYIMKNPKAVDFLAQAGKP
jgi:hypothetical protein